MFKNKQFSPWDAPLYDWSGVSDEEKLKNLDKLLDSNPVMNSRVKRNCGYNLAVLRELIKEEVEKIVENDVSKFPSEELFQQYLESKITQLLAEKHYIYCLNFPFDSSIQIYPKQFWWLASYFICRKKNNNSYSFHFFSEEFFHDEFYEIGNDNRRPSLVMECLSNKIFLMVPFTNRQGDGKLEMKNSQLPPRSRYAIYKFYFYAGCKMFKIGNTRNYKPFRLSNIDFEFIQEAIKKVP